MKNLLRSLRLRLNIFSFFDEFILIYPLYTLLFADKGLSVGQITSLLVAFSAATIIFELPTGSIADKHSRRNVMLAGMGLKVLAFIVWIAFQSYLGFFIGIILWSLKISLVSGAREAFIYDELVAIGHKKEYAKTLGDMEAVGTFGVIAAALGASLLAPHGYTVILAATILSAGVALCSVLFLPDSPRIRPTQEVKHWQHIHTAFKKVFKTQKIMYLQFILAFVVGFSVIEDYYGLFYQEHHFSNTQISLWMGLTYLFIALGSVIAGRIKSNRLIIMAFSCLWAVALLAASLLPAVISPVLIGIVGLGMSVVYVLSNSQLQAAVKDADRATMTSISSFLAEMVALAVFGAVYLSSRLYSYTFSIKIVGLISLGIIFLLAVWQKLSPTSQLKK